MDITLNFPPRPIIGPAGRSIGTIENTDAGYVVIHADAGELPIFADIHDAVSRALEVDQAVQEYDKAREAYENLYGRHERSLLLGVQGIPPKLLDNSRLAMEKANDALAELVGGSARG